MVVAMVDQAFAEADVDNAAVRAFVREWAEVTRPARIEVVGGDDDPRLIREALDADEILPAGRERYFMRSHPLDTARSEERTVVATSRESDRGAFNNWAPAEETVAVQRERMAGASQGKTMYVVPYLMAPPGTPLASYATGVQLTDDRTVVLHMIRMARVGLRFLDDLDSPGSFVRGVHVTGDLDRMGHGTPDDQRLFATVADQRMILHFGSAYGGNALLGKIAHGLRLASYDAWTSGQFLAEQFMLLAIVDTHTDRRYHICGGFPSASGKTNLAMTLSPEGLGERYRVEFYGDDIAWLWRGEDGRLWGMNPENGVFGVTRDTNEKTNPAAVAAMAEGSGTIFTNVARHDDTGELWWEGKTPKPPADVSGWRDWSGTLISERRPEERDDPWAHPNSRFTTTLSNVPTLAHDAEAGPGAPIDAIIFGGRVRSREPLIRAVDDLAEGVYDGLTLGAEATSAAEGKDGVMRYDPMSMRPFMSYPESDYARHWLDLLGTLTDPPVFAHVNWFQRDAEDGHFLWPGFRENLRALLWLMSYRDGEVDGDRTPVGVLPQPEELDLTGLDLPVEDVDRLLSVEPELWKAEMASRDAYLAQFPDLPEEILAAHERIKKAF